MKWFDELKRVESAFQDKRILRYSAFFLTRRVDQSGFQAKRILSDRDESVSLTKSTEKLMGIYPQMENTAG